MGDPILRNGILQGLSDGSLPDHFFKDLGSPLPCQYQIRHLFSNADCGIKSLFLKCLAFYLQLSTFYVLLSKNNLLIARRPCGTQGELLPLLPSGPGGVCNLLLRRTRLSTRFDQRSNTLNL